MADLEVGVDLNLLGENKITGLTDVEFIDGANSITITPDSVTGTKAVVLKDEAGTLALLTDIGGSESLAATLVVGNTSGGTNILMSGLDKIEFTDATNYLQKTAGEMLLQTTKGFEVKGPDTKFSTGSPDGIQVSNLVETRAFTLDPIGGELILKQSVSIVNDLVFDGTTVSRVWTLPDATGTVALLQDITIEQYQVSFAAGAFTAQLLTPIAVPYDTEIAAVTGYTLGASGEVTVATAGTYDVQVTMAFLRAAGGGQAGVTGQIYVNGVAVPAPNLFSVHEGSGLASKVNTQKFSAVTVGAGQDVEFRIQKTFGGATINASQNNVNTLTLTKLA